MIKAETDKYEKSGPCGNQNCQLCTWSMECFFRGIDVLPRPVYSPRDIIFNLDGYDIVRSPSKIKFVSMQNAIQIIKDAGDGSRFYTHVNWKGSNGGHEFITININQDLYVVDGQAGIVSKIDSNSARRYFEDINYANSYLVRMDDKELNKSTLSYNNISYLKKWDWDKDVKYMRDNDMLNEDDEEYLRNKMKGSANESINNMEVSIMNEFDNIFTDDDIANEGIFDAFKKKKDDSNNSKYANAKLTQAMRDEVVADAAIIDQIRHEIEKISNDWFEKANKRAFLTGIIKEYLKFDHTSMREYARSLKTLDDSGHFPIPIAVLDTKSVPENKLDSAKESFQEWYERYKTILNTFKNDKSRDFSKLCYEKATMHNDTIYVMAGWKVSTDSVSNASESANSDMNTFNDLFSFDDPAIESVSTDKAVRIATDFAVAKHINNFNNKANKTKIYQITGDDKKKCIAACKAAKAALKKEIPIVAEKYGFDPSEVKISEDLNTTKINDASADKMEFAVFSFNTKVKGLSVGHTKLYNAVKKAVENACPGMKMKPDPRGANYVISMVYIPTGKDVTKAWEKDVKGANESINGEETIMFDDIFNDNFATESVATNLRRDLQDDPEEAMSLKSMYNVYMNEDALKKYEDKYAQLKHVNKNAENLRGHMYFMNGELVAFISVEYKSGKTWIDTLEVVKKFRGNKLSFQLLDVAVRKFHATDLRVNKENEKAIGIFKTYGFKTYDHKGNWLYMTLRDDVKEIENEETEKAQPITDNLKSDMIKDAKQRAANEAAMDEGFDEFLAMCLEAANGVKSVDDLLDDAKIKLNRKLKTVEDCDAYLEVIKNESAKFNEACSCLISAYARYNHSKKERSDWMELSKTTNAAIMLLRQNCRRLNVSLGDIAHSEGKDISRNDIKRFGQYVAGLRKITNEIKDARKKGVALEFAEPAEEIDEAYIALESTMAADEFFAMMESDEDINDESVDSEIAEESADTFFSEVGNDDDSWRFL